MKQIELYVPLADNKGQDISRGYWDSLRFKLLDTFGGYTQTPECTGNWVKAGGAQYTDTVIIFRVVCPSDIAHGIKRIAKFVKNYWRQETVLYTVVNTDVHYV